MCGLKPISVSGSLPIKNIEEQLLGTAGRSLTDKTGVSLGTISNFSKYKRFAFLILNTHDAVVTFTVNAQSTSLAGATDVWNGDAFVASKMDIPANNFYRNVLITAVDYYRPYGLNDNEIHKKMKEKCISPLELALVEIAAKTECRYSDITSFERPAEEWDRKSLFINNNDQNIEVSINDDTAEIVCQYLNTRKDSDTALFVTERAPHRVGTAQMKYILKRIKKRCEP